MNKTNICRSIYQCFEHPHLSKQNILGLLYLDHFLETNLTYPGVKHSALVQACLASSVGWKQVSKEKENSSHTYTLTRHFIHILKFSETTEKQLLDYFSNLSRSINPNE